MAHWSSLFPFFPQTFSSDLRSPHTRATKTFSLQHWYPGLGWKLPQPSVICEHEVRREREVSEMRTCFSLVLVDTHTPRIVPAGTVTCQTEYDCAGTVCYHEAGHGRGSTESPGHAISPRHTQNAKKNGALGAPLVSMQFQTTYSLSYTYTPTSACEFRASKLHAKRFPCSECDPVTDGLAISVQAMVHCIDAPTLASTCLQFRLQGADHHDTSCYSSCVYVTGTTPAGHVL